MLGLRHIREYLISYDLFQIKFALLGQKDLSLRDFYGKV
jgi:hypothetical protein